MRKFMITVNGTAYEVEVEELGASAPAASTAAPVVPKAAPAAPKAAARAHRKTCRASWSRRSQ